MSSIKRPFLMMELLVALLLVGIVAGVWSWRYVRLRGVQQTIREQVELQPSVESSFNELFLRLYQEPLDLKALEEGATGQLSSEVRLRTSPVAFERHFMLSFQEPPSPTFALVKAQLTFRSARHNYIYETLFLFQKELPFHTP